MLLRPDLCVWGGRLGLKLSSLSLYSSWNFPGANVFYDVPGLSFVLCIYLNFLSMGLRAQILLCDPS